MSGNHTHVPTTWRSCSGPRDAPQVPGGTWQEPVPQASPDLAPLQHSVYFLLTSLLPSISLFSVANIVSDYTEKLCQSLLCLREGHLSFAVLNLKTS